MADRRELCVGGKPISSLRVVDLKVELEKRSLPKSGSKKDLLERLRLHLQLEEDREAALRDEEHVPNLSLCNETENDFIREYLAAQQARFQVQREAKKQYEEKKRESEASAEETTQDEDEASDVSPAKKSPRKAMRPKKKEESTSTPKAQKSALDFQTPDSMPYSTPPQDKRDDDAASHEDDTGEEEETRTPQTRKHKLLKYVHQPTASKGAGKSDTGQFSIADHVDNYQASGTSDRRDPPPSSLYGEAINLKVSGKKEPTKKETKKELSPVKKDDRPVRGQRAQYVKPASPEEIADAEEEEVFPRLVDVWSEKEREQEAAAAEKSSQKSRKSADSIVAQPAKEAEQNKPKTQDTETTTSVETNSQEVPPPDPLEVKPVKVEQTLPTESVVQNEHPIKEEESVPPVEDAIEESVPPKFETKVEEDIKEQVEIKPKETLLHVEEKMEIEETTPETIKEEVIAPKVEEPTAKSPVSEEVVNDPVVEENPVVEAGSVEENLVVEAEIVDPIVEAVDENPIVEAEPVEENPVVNADPIVDPVPDATVVNPVIDESPVVETSDTTDEPEPPVKIEEKKEDLPVVVEDKIDSEIQEKVDEIVTKEEISQEIESEPPKVETPTPMAIDNERPPVVKSDVPDQPLFKAEQPTQESQPTEDNEEDELQMDTTEIIDDSLKLTAGEDVAEHSEQERRERSRSRSSSRSPSQGHSSPEPERGRNGRSSSPHDHHKKVDSPTTKPETNKVETVRKWKIRKQQAAPEVDSTETGAPRKRRWGTSQLLPTKKPALVISTDSLKTLVPDAKPLSADEVRLGSPNFQVSTKPTVAQVEDQQQQQPVAEKVEKVEIVRRVAVEVAAEALAPAKPEVVLAAAAPLLEATSPAQQPRSCVLNVSNLVRPFTINQLKELLARTGHLIDGKFWIDKVKSSCLVQYETEEEAEETRAALHGIHWPTSNPKTLVVDYSTVEDLENRMSGKDVTNPPIAKVEPTMRAAAAAAVQSIEAKRDKTDKVREWDLGKTGEQGSEKEQTTKEVRPEDDEEVKPKDETPAKLLDDLFRKTKATPCIYWLPLTASQIAEKEEMRRQRLAERETRMREVQQRRDEELQQRQKEREKQRESERERQRARERDREKERGRERDRQRSRKRSRSSSSGSSSTSSSPNKRRTSKTPPRKR